MSSYPTRRSPRLRNYDYSRAGAYFVTLCTEKRTPLFGRIVDGEMDLSSAGMMVATVWGNLGRYYPVEVDAFVVMPNHLHGIFVLGGKTEADRDRAAVPTSTAAASTYHRGAMTLPAVIARFKTYTMHEYGKGVASHGWARYPGRLWQHRYHDRVVRNEREIDALREYIATNPLRWQLDRLNPDFVP